MERRKAAASSGMMGWDGMGWDGIGSEHKKIQTQGTHAHVASIKHGGPRQADRSRRSAASGERFAVLAAAAKKSHGGYASCR